MRFLSAFAVSSSRGTGRRGYPGAGSSTHSTHSGGLSQRSRSSTSRREAFAIAARARVLLVVGRGHVRCQAGRERKRLEGRARRVARVVALPEPRAEPERPRARGTGCAGFWLTPPRCGHPPGNLEQAGGRDSWSEKADLSHFVAPDRIPGRLREALSAAAVSTAAAGLGPDCARCRRGCRAPGGRCVPSARRGAGGGPRAAAGGRFESDHRRGDAAIITTPGGNSRKHWPDAVYRRSVIRP